MIAGTLVKRSVVETLRSFRNSDDTEAIRPIGNLCAQGIKQMHLRSFIVAFVMAMSVLCFNMFAQLDVNGPNASMTMQGHPPSTFDAVTHDVPVLVPGIFVFDIDSGINPSAGIVMCASLSDITVPQFFTPWGGSIDIGDASLGASSIVVVADGIGFTVNAFVDSYFVTSQSTVLQPLNRFRWSISLNQNFCGNRNAWQAIVVDPTMPPFFVDNTEAGDANFAEGQFHILLTGNDGRVNVPFLSGHSFPFHGTVYHDVWVNGNGYINFVQPTSVALNGSSVDAVSFATAEPSIAVALTDWNIGSGGFGEGVFYEERQTSSGGVDILISWGDPRGLPLGSAGMTHFNDTDSNNQIEILLHGDVNPMNSCGSPGTSVGDFSLMWPRLDNTAVTRPGDGIFGQTPGGASLIGPILSVDLLSGPFPAPSGKASIEEHNNSGSNQSTIGWNGAGGMRAYNNFFAVTGMKLDFMAATVNIPGDFGYLSMPTGFPKDDIESVLTPVSPLGGLLTIVGKYWGFGVGRVDIVDSSTNYYNNLPKVVTSGTGPIFVNEGLSVAYPAMSSGLATAIVTFDSGYVESVQFSVQ